MNASKIRDLSRSHLVRIAIAATLCISNRADAQLNLAPPAHPLLHSNQPPGSVGASQIRRGVMPAGYSQPVRVTVPAGALAEVADGGGYRSETHPLLIGLEVGHPYRFKVTGIPRSLGKTVYPSVELIGRLHPPEGERTRFPIPIEFAESDLQLAARGHHIVRVVYLENPRNAFPETSVDRTQRVDDVAANEDPLTVADQEGRPMAIIRIGSRTPLDGQIDDTFNFGNPPVEWLSPPTPRLGPPRYLRPIAPPATSTPPDAPAAQPSPSDRLAPMTTDPAGASPDGNPLEPPVPNNSEAGGIEAPDTLDPIKELFDPFTDDGA